MLITCVYCKEEKDFIRGRRDVFNSEHVVPESLASVRGSLTLIGIVCKSCNDWLGQNLDIVLTRGTHEALRRFVEKQKDVNKIHELDRRRVKMSLAGSKDESLKNAQVKLVHDQGELKQQFDVQLCIKLKGSNEWTTIPRAGFTEFAETKPDVDFSEFKILGSETETSEFFEEMKRFWPDIKITGEFGKDDVSIDVDVVVDYGPTERRAIAKIAFNYFCYITQHQPEVARGSQFDPIRNFIRNGETPAWEIVTPRDKPILTKDTVNKRQTNGHIVAFDVERNPLTGKKEAVCLISIFNDLTWRVVLQPDFAMNLKSKIHLWDFQNGVCEELIAKKVRSAPYHILLAQTVPLAPRQAFLKRSSEIKTSGHRSVTD